MVFFRRHSLSIAASVLLGACTSYEGSNAPTIEVPVSAAEAAAAVRIESDVRFLADDALEGREAGTAGYDQAADYVASRLAALGAAPGVAGDWFQVVPLLSATSQLDAAQFAVTNAAGRTTSLTNLKDFRISPSMAADSFAIDAPAVFVGFGVSAPDAGHDDYAGLDVEGKIVVAFIGAPDIFNSEQRAHFGSSAVKREEAAERGAVGLIALYTTEDLENRPWSRLVSNPNWVSMTWIAPDGAPDVSGAGVKGSAVVHPEKAALLFEGAARSYEDVLAEADAEGEAPKGFELNVRVSMAGALARAETTSPNVVGVIEGADPARRDEYVVLTAHLDHTGVNLLLVDQGEDGIHNGAMDNALGVAVILETARALLADERPARSILIVAVTAEEKGLLGADYFAHYPTVPKDAMIANINLDMPVMLHAFTDVIAFGAERSSLGDITKRALADSGVGLLPDPIPELGIFTRSDHYRFVEQGVPAVYLWTGFGNGGEDAFWDFYYDHYHRPSDDLALPIRYGDAARFARINTLIARAVANADERPRWKEDDFFGDLFAN